MTKKKEARRFCYYIPPDQQPDPKDGYRVAVVYEDEDGYHWTGDEPGTPGGRRPWYWGKTLEEAEKICAEQNQEKLGLSAKEADILVMRSMARAFSK